jgi:hypothetical protein
MNYITLSIVYSFRSAKVQKIFFQSSKKQLFVKKKSKMGNDMKTNELFHFVSF